MKCYGVIDKSNLGNLSEEHFIMGVQYICIEKWPVVAFLFTLKTETSIRGPDSMPFLIFRPDHLRSTSGIICGPIWGLFAVWGSFAVGDHMRRCTVQWLAVVHEMRCFCSFSEVLEGILDVKG